MNMKMKRRMKRKKKRKKSEKKKIEALWYGYLREKGAGGRWNACGTSCYHTGELKGNVMFVATCAGLRGSIRAWRGPFVLGGVQGGA